MTDKNILSKEEIEALLKTIGESAEEERQKSERDYATERSIDCIKAKINKRKISDDGGALSVYSIIETKSTLDTVMSWQVGDFIPMDMKEVLTLVNGTLVAHGEVVVVNNTLGVRLTDIVSKAE